MNEKIESCPICGDTHPVQKFDAATGKIDVFCVVCGSTWQTVPGTRADARICGEPRRRDTGLF